MSKVQVLGLFTLKWAASNLVAFESFQNRFFCIGAETVQPELFSGLVQQCLGFGREADTNCDLACLTTTNLGPFSPARHQDTIMASNTGNQIKFMEEISVLSSR